MPPRSVRVRTLLLAHYDRAGRSLPWRATRDPYAIWVSEIMLQQTRVETVIPYYVRWMRRFPTVAALAESSVDEALTEWAGLGYYSRARNLHAAAGMVCRDRGGQLPSDPPSLRGLPGVGAYTAGAIASIAFGQPVPAVDGNARRVICRVYDLDGPADDEVLQNARELVDVDRPGDSNQALMDLGATLCRPRRPRCEACPLSNDCLAKERGTLSLRPARPSRRPRVRRDFSVAVAADSSGRVLLRRRPERGLLGGMWEFPACEVPAGEEAALVCGAALREALDPAAFPTVPDRAVHLGVVDHDFSHFSARYHAYLFAVGRSMKEEAAHTVRWMCLDGADRLALPVAQRKILGLAGAFIPGAGAVPGETRVRSGNPPETGKEAR